MVLTSKERAEFRKKGEEYAGLKYVINEQIANLEIQKSKLEKKLEEALPATPNGSLICPHCGIKSMAYIPPVQKRSSKSKEKSIGYECEVCGHTESADFLYG